jgi:hypothetical protein
MWLRAQVEHLQTTLKKIVQGSGGAAGGEQAAEGGGSRPLMQVLDGLDGQAHDKDSVFVGSR